MGTSFGKSIGPRSGYHPDPNTNAEIDYRDPMYAERAKRELYALFLDEKIVHISNLEESQEKIKKLTQEVDRLQKLINISESKLPVIKTENKIESTLPK